MPFFDASSIIFKATIIGFSKDISSMVNSTLLINIDASIILTITSISIENKALTVSFSASSYQLKEYVPGKSITSTSSLSIYVVPFV